MNSDNNNVRKEAVALSFHPDSSDAPIVTAIGKGKTADVIIEKAVENQIPIKEDPALVTLLGKRTINEKIPPELYQAVAEVFAFVYQLDKNAKNGEK